MKDIKNYEGLYAITEEGQVYSHKSKKYLKPREITGGYLGVTLYKDGKGTQYRIHRLVAETYLPNPDNLPIINHKSEDKTDNRVENLEWCSHEYNSNYGTIKEKITQNASNKNIHIYCIELQREFESAKQAAEELGITRQNIVAVCRGKRITAGGYHWRYADE